MKLTLKFILLSSLFFLFNSCTKESSERVLFENEERLGTITERGLEVPTGGKCDCQYEIVDFNPINHSDYRYWLKGVSKTVEDGCPNCPDQLFEGRYYCLDGDSPFCYNVHNEPIPVGLFDFNCLIKPNVSFTTSVNMKCCQNDLWDCMLSDEPVHGKMAYRIHCKLVGKVSNDTPQNSFDSSDCDELYSSDIIHSKYHEFTGPVIVKVNLGGDCGCEPMVVE